MNLNQPTEENLKYILEQLSKKLDVANQIVLDPKGYDLAKYEDLKPTTSKRFKNIFILLKF